MSHSINQKYLFVFCIASIFLLLLIRNAWLGDDAYISFRVVDNFVNGYGLTWNTNERVQAYTNPLWVLLLSVIYFFFQNIYYVAIITSIVLSLVGMIYLFISANNPILQSLLLFCLLITSKAFIEYSTSGLENPLTNFLLITFVVLFLKTENFDTKNIILLSFIAALALVNRMDNLLLLAPSLFLILYYNRTLKTFLLMTIGFLPFIAWEVFALVYYGFPFPNTAYAKLNGNIPFTELLLSGGVYWWDIFIIDPVTPMTILFSIFIAFFMKKLRYLTLGIGTLLFLIYMTKIGGDFMSGRFFATPFVIAISLLVLMPLPKKVYFALIILISIGMSWGYTRFSIDPLYEYTTEASAYRPSLSNINDERSYFYVKTGLLRKTKGSEFGEWLQQAPSQIRAMNKTRKLTLKYAIGFYGFFSQKDHYIIDGHGLAEPFLSRMPAQTTWRPGHFTYHFPQGYLRSRYTGINHIKNPYAAKLYDNLELITKGNIWQLKRFIAILEMNFLKNEFMPEQVMITFYQHFYNLANPIAKSKLGSVTKLEQIDNNIINVQGIVPMDENELARLVVTLETQHFVDWELVSYQKLDGFAKFSLNFFFQADENIDLTLQPLCIGSYPKQYSLDFSKISLLNNQHSVCDQYLLK